MLTGNYISENTNNLDEIRDKVLANTSMLLTGRYPYKNPYNINDIRAKILAHTRKHLDTKYVSQYNWKNQSDKIYIPPKATILGSHINENQQCNLIEQLDQFLQTPTQEVAVILGDPASGKTTLGKKWLQKYLLQEKIDIDDPIPIFIELRYIDKRHVFSDHNLLEHVLSDIGLSPCEVGMLKEQQRIVVFIEGYDEIREDDNLYTKNEWNEWKNAQFVITCRSEKFSTIFEGSNLSSELVKAFSPEDGNYLPASMVVFQMNSFTEENIEEYIKRWAETAPLEQRTIDYIQALKSIPGLRELATNPMNLSIILDCLPTLVENNLKENNEKRSLNITDIYTIFVSKWLNNQIMQLCDGLIEYPTILANKINDEIEKIDIFGLVQLLVNNSCNRLNNKKVHPLLDAILNDQFLVVKFLLDFNIYHEFILYDACENSCSVEMLQFLFINIPDISINKKIRFHFNKIESILLAALKGMGNSGDRRSVDFLLEAGGIKTEKDFYNAIEYGPKLIKLMLDVGYQCTPEILKEAIHESGLIFNTEVVDILVKNSTRDVIEKTKSLLTDRSDLCFYISTGYLGKVRFILASLIVDFDTNELIKLNSFSNENKEIIFSNIASQKEISDFSKEIYEVINSSFMYAVKLNRIDIAQLLLSTFCADINYKDDKYAATPFFEACKLGHTNMIKLLLQYNPDVNQFYENNTPLSIATKKGHAEVVDTLLQLENINPDLSIGNKYNKKTINRLGMCSDNNEIANLYFKHNAKPYIVVVENEIKKQIKHFRKNGESIFDVNSNKKADKLQIALQNAKESIEAQLSLDNFLNHKNPGHESIQEALNYHRIGGSNQTDSCKKMKEKLGRKAYSLRNNFVPSPAKENMEVRLDPYWKKQWKEIYRNTPSDREFNTTLELLARYAGVITNSCFFLQGKGGRLGRFFNGNWGRHHGDDVQSAIRWCYSFDRGESSLSIWGVLCCVKKCIEESDSKHLNPNGDLAKIIKVIEANTGIIYNEIDTNELKTYSINYDLYRDRSVDTNYGYGCWASIKK